jgi:hypothetical protein
MTGMDVRVDSTGAIEDWLLAELRPRTTASEQPTAERRLIRGALNLDRLASVLRVLITPRTCSIELAERGIAGSATNASSSKPDRVLLPPLPSYADQLADIQAWLGLNKVQLAQVCRVERQTIYDWFSRQYEPAGANAQRVTQLYKIAAKWRERGLARLPLRASERSLSDGGTLLDLLTTPEIDLARTESAMEALGGASVNEARPTAAAVRERLGWKPLDQRQREQSLSVNLDRLRRR